MGRKTTVMKPMTEIKKFSEDKMKRRLTKKP
jgi:hypothetical protein